MCSRQTMYRLANKTGILIATFTGLHLVWGTFTEAVTCPLTTHDTVLLSLQFHFGRGQNRDLNIGMPSTAFVKAQFIVTHKIRQTDSHISSRQLGYKHA